MQTNRLMAIVPFPCRGRTQAREGHVPAVAVLTLGVAALLSGTQAQAAGFAVREQSAAAQGMADAGISAGSGGLSSSFYNPATLALLEGGHISNQLAGVFANVHYSSYGAANEMGTPITGGDGGNIPQDVMVPSLYASYQLSPDWHVGLSVTIPFGFKTGGDDGWVGRYHALTSDIEAYDITPMVAWQATPWLALGAGFEAQYTYARLTNAIDYGTVAAANGVPIQGANPALDGYGDLHGSDWSYGYTLGALITPRPGTRIGLGYRSKMQVAIEGTAKFTNSSLGNVLSNVSGAFVNTDARAAVTLPETITLGITQDLSPEWTVASELAWTHWSRFNQLNVTYANPVQPDTFTEENWRNSIFVSLGVTYKPADDWRLRAGVAYDQGVDESAQFRTPRIPDSDRYWTSVGGGYDITKWLTVDAAYTHIFAPDSSIAQSASGAGNEFRGSMYGSNRASADVVSLGFEAKF
ncbi:MAG: outer membrane protein transport protein [Parvibaculaceae bacterium]|nr:outer membrane protein transport protein [Parvibaculaceae bacterium]